MGLWATGPPGTHKYIKISHIVISGTVGIRANKVAVMFATGIVQVRDFDALMAEPSETYFRSLQHTKYIFLQSKSFNKWVSPHK